MTYRILSSGKIVICKEGVYFQLNKEQLQELKALIADIESGERKYYEEGSRR